MHDRALLGPADVDDATLAAMVAGALDARDADVEVLDSRVEEFPYDLPAITTAGRYVVRGTADVDGHRAPYALFVKVVQSWARSPMFHNVPEPLRDWAEASVPWRTEPLAYRSDLAGRLPDGLTMPRALGVFDLDDRSASVWLPVLCIVQRPWDAARYARAAHLLGRLAGSPRVAELAEVGGHAFTMADFRDGRLRYQVLPMLMDDDIWRHPLVAATFEEELRTRLRAAAERVPAYVDELLALPHLAAHGDACPNNLLATADSDDFVLIDYGFWKSMPVGADLAQLLVGDVQIGRERAGDLAAKDERLVAAYVDGLRAEGCDLPADVVRRPHALHLLLMSGLSALPDDLLGADPTDPSVVARSQDRATIARLALDLVDA